jgi:hypothetical protein
MLDEYSKSIMIDEKQIFHKIEQKIFKRNILFIVSSFLLLSIGHIMLVIEQDINIYVKLWCVISTILIYQLCMNKLRGLIQWKF